MIAAVAAVAITAAGTAAGASEELAKSSGCMGCHNIEGKKVARRRRTSPPGSRGKANAESALVTKVSEATGHPKVKAQGDDVKTLVKWVLSR